MYGNGFLRPHSSHADILSRRQSSHADNPHTPTILTRRQSSHADNPHTPTYATRPPQPSHTSTPRNMRVDQSQKDSSIGPNIRTKRDLASLCEVEDSVTGAIIRSTFTYVDDQDVAWFGQAHGIRKYDLAVGDLTRLLKRVPDEKIYPLKPAGTAVVSEAVRKKLYIKRPKLLCLDNKEETKLLPRLLLEEAEVLQYLNQHHHPNLIRFHGCVVNRGRITGIALDKYKVILRYRFEDVPHDLDIDACMEGIRAGVKHLHSHRLAHNDLNPTNIALDSDDNPVIFDLGSCKKFGEKLLSGGTPGWVDEDYTISAQRHDELAMEKIEAWLVAEKAQRRAQA